jgi:hypothetical protein
MSARVAAMKGARVMNHNLNLGEALLLAATVTLLFAVALLVLAVAAQSFCHGA